jgi:hypothetical protein
LTTTTAALNNGDQQNLEAPASGNDGNVKTGGDANVEHDYITMADLLQDTSDDNNEDGGNVNEKELKDLDIVELFEAMLIVTTTTTFCLGARGRWRILER